MHAFSNHSEKNPGQRWRKWLSIGKKFEKYSKSERKEAHKKALLEHEQSKDKQGMVFENILKDVDDIIKAMTPETLTQE